MSPKPAILIMDHMGTPGAPTRHSPLYEYPKNYTLTL